MNTTPRTILLAAITVLAAAYLFHQADALKRKPTITPGKQPDGSVLVTTNQAVTPIGEVRETEGVRPKDLALSPDGLTLAVLANKQNQALLIYSALTAELESTVPLNKLNPDALGIAWSHSGKYVYASCQNGAIARIAKDGAGWKQDGVLRITGGAGDPQLLGLAVSPDDTRLYVAMGRRNAVAILSLPDGALLQTVSVGAAPYRVLLSHNGNTLYAANRGGPLVSAGVDAEDSGGTRVAVDPETDATLSGSLSIIDVSKPEASAHELPVGRQPAGMALTRDDKTLYVANSDSDTVDIVDTAAGKVLRSFSLMPAQDRGFGQVPTSLALSEDEKTLYVACGGENAVATVNVAGPPHITGYLPAGWFPIAVAQQSGRLYIASSKGVGPRILDPKKQSYYVHNSIGTVQFVATTKLGDRAGLTRRVAENNRWGRELAPRQNRPPVPVPERVGEPSVFKHVIYILKENQTYDSLLGDMPEGNGDKALNLYNESVCPNHHKLARDFVLLDNTFTSGSNSADGHQWCDEAVANGYIEQNYDAHVRSYPYDGGDPLAYSPNGFLWTAALRKRLSVRVYGEFVNRPTIRANQPGLARTWSNLWKDRNDHASRFTITAGTDSKALAPYLNPRSIGFPLVVSDQYRADQFLTELEQFNKTGIMPNLSILLLPCDHTSGRSSGMPTPAAEVADNDLALGRIVEGVSHSQFWKDTLILVVEDDSQASVDHVDGHRTAAFCISAYTKRRTVVSEYYNHTSLLRTMELVLGLPAMTRFDRTATPMNACFAAGPNLSPYVCAPNQIPLDTINPAVAQLKGEARRLAGLSNSLDWSDLDRADPAVVARADWNSIKPNTPFPSSLYNAYGDDDDAGPR